jgi:hypothetical protein
MFFTILVTSGLYSECFVNYLYHSVETQFYSKVVRIGSLFDSRYQRLDGTLLENGKSVSVRKIHLAWGIILIASFPSKFNFQFRLS